MYIRKQMRVKPKFTLHCYPFLPAPRYGFGVASRFSAFSSTDLRASCLTATGLPASLRYHISNLRFSAPGSGFRGYSLFPAFSSSLIAASR